MLRQPEATKTQSRRTFLKDLGVGLSLSLTPLKPGSSSARPPEKTRVWDIHCHLSHMPGETPEERTAALLKYADRMGIERLVLSMGFPLHQNPTPEQVRFENDQALGALRSWPSRTLGLVYLNPNDPDFSVQEFDRCVRDGPMVGIKLWVARHCNARDLDPIVQRAVSMNVPILQHTWLKVGGNGPGESTPFDLVELAGRHPQATIICGHSGGDWERGIRVVRSTKNVSIELAGSDPTNGFVEMAVRELGAERVIFGSDAGGRSFASQLAKVTAAQISENAKDLILGGNLRRLLTPILTAKGRRP